MKKILIAGNINWFNLREMHVKPLIQLGYDITVISDVDADSADYTKNITLITLNKPEKSFKGLLILAKWLILATLNGKIFSRKELKRIKFLSRHCLDYINQIEKIDLTGFSVAHCHFITRPVCIALCNSAISLPIISTIHGSDLYVSSSNTYVDWLAIEKCVQRSRHVIVPGIAERNFAVELGFDEKKFRVLSWGVNLNHFCLPADIDYQNQLKNKWHLTGKKVVLSCRNLKPIYNISSIVEAFASLAERKATILLIAGNGIELAALKEQASILQLDHNVRFVGHLNHQEMLELYQLSDVYIQNPLSDALPYSMLEALVCGLPVVCGEIGNISQLKNALPAPLQDSVFLSEPGVLSASQLGQLLQKALLNQKRFFQRDQQYAELINENYSLDKSIAKVEQLYKDVTT